MASGGMIRPQDEEEDRTSTSPTAAADGRPTCRDDCPGCAILLGVTNDAPERPPHLATAQLGIDDMGSNILLHLRQSTRNVPRVVVQHAVCRSFDIDDGFGELLSSLMEGQVPREVTLDHMGPGDELRVVWYAMNGNGKLFPFDVTEWVALGNVCVKGTMAIRVHSGTKNMRKRAHDDLVDSIENCKRHLPSEEYRLLYDAAKGFYDSVDGLK